MNALQLVHFVGVTFVALFSWLASRFLSLPVLGARSRAALNTLGNFALYISLAATDESVSLLNDGLRTIIRACEALLESTKVVEIECGGTSDTSVVDDKSSSASSAVHKKTRLAFSSKLHEDAIALDCSIEAAYVCGLLTRDESTRLRLLKSTSRDELLLMHWAHGLNAIRFAGFAREMLASNDGTRSS